MSRMVGDYDGVSGVDRGMVMRVRVDSVDVDVDVDVVVVVGVATRCHRGCCGAAVS